MSERPPLPAAIRDSGVLAIMRGLAPANVASIAAALRDGGVEAIEVTLDSPGALESIAALAEAGALAGAGTVLDVGAAERAVAAGARFLVAPDTRPEVIRWAVGRGVPILPGALTPTEIRAAWEAGAAAVKLFPAFAVGPEYLRAVAAPLAGIPLIPTGGVDGDNAPTWRAAGAAAVAVGSWLTAPDDPALITRRAAALARRPG